MSVLYKPERDSKKQCAIVVHVTQTIPIVHSWLGLLTRDIYPMLDQCWSTIYKEAMHDTKTRRSPGVG